MTKSMKMYDVVDKTQKKFQMEVHDKFVFFF